MKRLLISIWIVFSFASIIDAQIWSCDSLKSDIQYFQQGKAGNKKWSEWLKFGFPLNRDGQVELNYVLTSSDTIPRVELVSLTEGWLSTVFTNVRNQIEETNHDRIICVGDLGQVAYEQKYIGATRIMAPLEIMVLYKDNRVRLTLLTRNYRMTYANVGQLESNVVKINDTYPFDDSSKHKSAYAMAYINTLGKLLSLADGYLVYLNEHKADVQREIPEW